MTIKIVSGGQTGARTMSAANAKEVDFVCQRGSQRLYVQVAVDLSQDGIVHRYLPDFLLESECGLHSVDRADRKDTCDED